MENNWLSGHLLLERVCDDLNTVRIAWCVQGSDPQTDFRGMGALSLRCLVYMAENYPNEVATLVKAQEIRWGHSIGCAVAHYCSYFS